MAGYGDATYGAGAYGGEGPSSLEITVLDGAIPSPGATTTDTAVIARTAGNGYIIYVTTFRGSSLNPDSVTLSQWTGETFSELAAATSLWASTGTTRRRTQVFKTLATTTASEALRFSYANQPSKLSYRVVEITGSQPTINVSTNIQSSATGSTANILSEPITMVPPGSANNRYIVYAVVNLASGVRLELIGDTGAEASWLSSSQASSAVAPTLSDVFGYLDGDPAQDLTPGTMTTQNSLQYRVALEVDVGGGTSEALSATATGVAAGTGRLSSLYKLVGTSDGLASVLGVLDTIGAVQLSAASGATSGGSVTLDVLRSASGEATGASAVTGALFVLRSLTGSGQAVADVTGTLHVEFGTTGSRESTMSTTIGIPMHTKLKTHTRK